MDSDIHQELHQIELTAHTLLSGSFDNLNENFESLSQSQLILLTRLKVIESKLQEFQNLRTKVSLMKKIYLINFIRLKS